MKADTVPLPIRTTLTNEPGASAVGVSVVIPTVGREVQLRRAVNAVVQAAQQLDEPVEVIIADDSPAVPEQAAAEKILNGILVRTVYSAHFGLKGPAAARNVGVASARFDIIAFTDDDARCDELWLRAGVERLRESAELAGVEGSVRIDPETPIDPVRSRLVVNVKGGGYLTASLFVRADAVRAAGGFRRLRTDGTQWSVPYREDTDLALRVIKRCGPVPFEPAAVVLHPAEPIALRRLVTLARYFVVDAAFRRVHPEVVQPPWRRPLARLRIRLALLTVMLVPGLAARRTRRPSAALIAAAALAASAQFEVELRAAGVHRTLIAIVEDTLRRWPRSLIWLLVAGVSRLQGEAMVALNLVTLPQPDAPGRQPRSDAPSGEDEHG
ncbi:MAG: glycosyltransferase family 2 protein [Solirubrobacteraceae bacterium]